MYIDGEDLMCQLLIKVAERASWVPIVARHLIADLRAMDGRHAALEVQIEHVLLHPSQQQAEPFTTVLDGRNNSLVKLKDFIDGCGYRTRSADGF